MTKRRRLLKTKVLIPLLPPPPGVATNADCAKVSGLLRCLQSNQSKKERQTMKNIRFLVIVLTIATFVLSACGGAATSTPGVGSVKVQAMPVAFLGSVDSIAGDQWVISGTTVTVDPAVVRDGPFNVGDQVKVEGVV